MSKRYKVAIGGMSHESNTFNPIKTYASDFLVLKGKEFKDKVGDNYNSAKGLFETLRTYGYEVIPTIFARAVPNGVVSKNFYLQTKETMLRMLSNIENLDSIGLALHGSMRVEDIGDAEGSLLSAIRELFPHLPIFVALDMHATMTEKMIESANGFVGYKTAPHIDTYQTGAHAAKLIYETLEGGKKIFMSAYKIPMLIAGEKSETSAEPMKSMIELVETEETRDDVLAASFLLGFPWADTPDAGVTSLVISTNEKTAKERAKFLAGEFWHRKEDFKFHVETHENNEAIEIAIEAKERPLYLSDSGDNPTAGATGDSNDFLIDLLNHRLVKEYKKDILYSGFYDPYSIEKCFFAGLDKEVDIELGGHFDKLNGAPVSLRVKVLKLVLEYGPYKSKLALVKYKNILIVITSKHIGFGDDKLLEALGIDPYKCDIVILKLGYLEDCFKLSSKRAMMASSKGASSEILENLPFKKVKRPIYPLDKNFNIDIDKLSIG